MAFQYRPHPLQWTRHTRTPQWWRRHSDYDDAYGQGRCDGPLDGSMRDCLLCRTVSLIWLFVVRDNITCSLCRTAQQATSRTIFAISRDHGLPDRGFFGHMTKATQTPLRAVALATFLAIIPGLLGFASPVAAFAIFAMCAVSLDLSYIIPIACRRIFANHPEVMFKPGPFYMGDGFLGLAANVICITWTCFVCVVLSMPTVLPTNKLIFNYAAPITVGVLLLSTIWYLLSAHKHYKGPMSRPNNPTGEKERIGPSDEIHPIPA
ncbi:hypothetical protein FRC14_002790 [Serendipita sp. 396]|nr:hypothetical protein FRC14_002790 [Serendipita sp. 396]